MNGGLSALAYLEWRQIVNRCMSVVRRPGRALLYLFVFAYFTFIAVFRARNHGALPGASVAEPYASAIFFAYVTLLGVMAYGAASGVAGTFSSSAEALFLTRSHIPERLVVMWLQLRRCASAILRMTFTLVIYTVMFAASGLVLGVSLAVVAGSALAAAIAIPMLKLRAVAGMRSAQSFAGALAAAGLLPLLVLLSTLIGPEMRHAAHGIEQLGAGRAVNAVFGGNPAAVWSFFGAAALLIGGSFAVGTGLGPELYAASIRASQFRERAKRGGGAVFAMEHAYRRSGGSSQGREPLRGSWTIVWKEWLALRRSGSIQRLFVLGAGACVVCGTIFGRMAAASKDPLLETALFAYMATNLIVMFVAMGSAIGLAADLRKPLWWIGPDPLWMRLLAWMCGTSWRVALALCAGVAAWAIAMRAPGLILAGFPVAAAAVLQLRAVGLVLYALFPSSVDQRGPLALVRALLTYLLALPPALLAVAGALLLHSAAAGAALAIAASIAETALLLAVASARISGSGVAFAQAEAL
ncbi:MAG TPA: putative ABC exporter domain-containing protein [Candidatus Baltobacteraceae bacterium]|nr:putative ABC exporter domain-containing protein [Candidatus Baltobacteraceae bacterium]